MDLTPPCTNVSSVSSFPVTMLRRVLAADVFPFSHQRDGESYYELNPGARGNHLADDSFDPPSSYEKRRRGDDSDSDTSTSIRKGVRRGTSMDDHA